MKKKLIYILLIFFSVAPLVNAESNQWLNLDWTLKQGPSYYSAKKTSQITKLNDGTYITETLDDYGLGVIRRVSNDGKKIIWEYENEYGYYYGNIIEKNGYIYTTYFDVYYGTYLIQYDLDGKYVDEIQLTDLSDCELEYCDYPRVYDLDMYLKDDKLYIVNYYDYSMDNGGISGDMIPYYYHVVDISEDELYLLTTTRLKDLNQSALSQIYSHIDTVSSGYGTIITKEFGERNEELGSDELFITQQFNSGENTYFVGYEVSLINNQRVPLKGFIYKVDKEGNILWMKKSPQGMLYYDVTSLSEEYVAVTAYSFLAEEDMYHAYIYVYNKEGEIVETHDINKELGTYSADIMLLQSFDGEIMAQVLTSDADYNYDTYLMRYIPAQDIKKVVKGSGEIKAATNSLPGTIVEFEVTPNKGFVLGAVKVYDNYGNEVRTNGNTFVMPASTVTIEATFLPENPDTFKELSAITAIVSVIIGSFLGLLLVRNKKVNKEIETELY